MIDDVTGVLTRILASAVDVAAAAGIDVDELARMLADGADPSIVPAAAGRTIADYVPELLQAMAGDQSETRRTYKTGFVLLASGIVLHWPYRRRKGEPMHHKPWDDDRVQRWLAAAHAVNRREKLGLDLPAAVEDCARNDDGAVVVWPGHGHVPVAALTESQVRVVVAWAKLRALATAAVDNADRRAAGRAEREVTADGAARNLICAVRYLYDRAAGDRIVRAGQNPAAGITIRGGRSGGRVLITEKQKDEALRVFGETGEDPELDAWLGYFHLHTGSRQEGAWRLEMRMVDRDRQLVYVPDKGSPVKRGKLDDDYAVPVSEAFVDGLLAFAAIRGSSAPNDPVFRTLRQGEDGAGLVPVTRRHYDSLGRRMRTHTDWADDIGFGVHHLRHYTSAEVEGLAGRAVKQRFLRHRPNGQTDVYGKGTLAHLAWAMATLTGHPHPLAERPPWVDA